MPRKQQPLQNEADAILQAKVEQAIFRAIGVSHDDEGPGPLERKCAVAAIGAIQEGGHAIVPLNDLKRALQILRFVQRTAGDEDIELDGIIDRFDTVIANTSARQRPADWLR